VLLQIRRSKRLAKPGVDTLQALALLNAHVADAIFSYRHGATPLSLPREFGPSRLYPLPAPWGQFANAIAGQREPVAAEKQEGWAFAHPSLGLLDLLVRYASAATTFTRLPWRSNVTTPSASANRVSSLPRPTLWPGR